MIPIMFNHDDSNNEKKGNIRAQDLASLIGINMAQQVGVLNIFDTPCDAYQVSVSTGYATVTFHKGYVCVYGRLIYVEEGEQVQVQIPTDTSTVTGSFGIRINLGESGANEVSWFTKTTTLQTDNLLNNEIDGVYEFLMYNFTATSSSLTLTKRFAVVNNLKDFMLGANFETKESSTNDTSLATTAFVHALINAMGFNYKGFTQGGATELLAQTGTYGHWYKVIDFQGIRVICGHVYNCPQNVAIGCWWQSSDKVSDTKITLCSFATNGQGMDEPLHFIQGDEVNSFLSREIQAVGKPANVDGFAVYNSNGRVNVDCHYLVIGVKP